MRRFVLFLTITILGVFFSCTNIQEDVPDSLYVEIKVIEFSESGETRSISVSSGIKWDITNLPSWISIDGINRSPASPYEWNVVMSTSANDDYNREGTIVFMAGSEIDRIAVMQVGKKGVKPEFIINGHEYVEMGNGLKWATVNIGASKQEDYGSYFAWGETKPKDSYSWDTYFDYTGHSFNKYEMDKQTRIEFSDDAARQNWGSTWRIPTDEEWTWLWNNCVSTWSDDYNGTGVSGLLVTSVESGFEGNSIFLPAAGYQSDISVNSAGSQGSYWSSSLGNNNNSSAYARGVLFFSGNNYRGYYYRCYGLSIRPVSD